MSHASHHGPADASGGHDHHHFDGVPTDELAPDEPRTPGWLTLLGVGLALAVLLAFALGRPDDRTREELSRNAGGTPSAAPAAAPARNAAERPSRPTRPSPPAGLPSGFPTPRMALSALRRPPAAPARPAPARPPAPPAAPAR